MEENMEMVEQISEEAVNNMLSTETVKSSALPVVILGVATLGVGFLIYKGIKYVKNKKKYVDVTPENVRNFSNLEENPEESEED